MQSTYTGLWSSLFSLYVHVHWILPTFKMLYSVHVLAAILALTVVSAFPRAPLKFYSTGDAKFRDCVELHLAGYRSSGIYRLTIGNTSLLAPCLQGKHSSWTVIQQRVDARENFVRYWQDYKNGFGSSISNFWMGLDAIHGLTQYHDRYLQVNLQDWSGQAYWAAYTKVFVSDESDGYRIVVSGYYGNATADDFSHQSGQRFATLDRPDTHGCVKNQHGGWWYNYCAFSLLNGRYYTGGYYPEPPTHFWDGIFWKDLYGYNYSMKFANMIVGKPNVTAV